MRTPELNISNRETTQAEITEPSLLIRINRAYRSNFTKTELYDYTRGQWKINPERAKYAQYGFSVYKGIIKEVYVILDWYEAGKTFSIREADEDLDDAKGYGAKGRYEFIGNIAPSIIRNKYLNKSVAHYFKKGNANPVLYLNC